LLSIATTLFGFPRHHLLRIFLFLKGFSVPIPADGTKLI
jgi:hypothetical protein